MGYYDKSVEELILLVQELQLENNSIKEILDKEIKNRILEKEEKDKRATELILANKELYYQNGEKEKRAAELQIANRELAYQNAEKEKRAAELQIANKELAYQNAEKEKRAEELIIANKELHYQNAEKEKRAAELQIANKELAYQNVEKEKRAEELLEAKERAEESDRLKTAFLQNMSHEIRTPMNGIMGFAELLKTTPLSGEEQGEYITLIEQSGYRMLDIINDIVNISKIEIGQMDVVVRDVHVNSLLKHLYSFFRPEAEKRGLFLSYKAGLYDDGCSINTDAIKLTQVLSNLIKNALKFTRIGSIDFGYKCEENMFKFYIQDTGIGIIPELQENIFERFRQVDMSPGRNYEGVGLGLAICKGYVEKLGGKIWVESDFGKGATFYFTVPYQYGGDSRVRELNNLSSVGGGSPKIGIPAGS